MIDFYVSPWRHQFRTFLRGVTNELIMAAPFIKTEEAKWILGNLGSVSSESISLKILTNLRSESVLNRSLDIEALLSFASHCGITEIINLPKLHAKVYIADERMAIITSANLTSPGLDTNLEYGIALTENHFIRRIKDDLENYARLGNNVSLEVLKQLSAIGSSLVEEYEKLQKSADNSLKKIFNRKLQSATLEFIKAQVGQRSAYSIFSEVLLYVLQKGPMTTRELHPRIKRILPELCDDSVDRIINGQHFGKKWKHHIRNVQQHLKYKGIITFDGHRWAISSKTLTNQASDF